MGNLQHVYLTAHGNYASGGWVGETGQIGVRLAIEPEASLPAKGTVFTLQESGAVVADSGTQAGTHGTLTKAWTARLGGTGSTENADAAWQIDLAEDFWTFLNSIRGYQGPSWRWTHVKIAPICADGSYGAPAAVYQFTSALAGAGSVMNAPEVSLALTFRAPIIGRRGRGRFYLPAVTADSSMLTADGVVLPAAQTAILGFLTTFVSNLENAPGTEEQTPLVAVLSAGSATGVRPSQVRVGNHFDVQKRRQAQIPETYSSSSL